MNHLHASRTLLSAIVDRGCQPLARTRSPFSRLAVFTSLSVTLGLPGALHAQRYLQTNLVSDVPGLAPLTDPNLVNPWGLSRSATSNWWVADNGTGRSTLYNGVGTINALVVTIPNVPTITQPSTPTGTVFNGTPDFLLGPNQPALFLFVTEEGTLSGWNPGVNRLNAILKVDNSGRAGYKGLAIGQINGANVLYAANFSGGTIDVFDKNFQPVDLGRHAFRDRRLPRHYAPFNVQAIGNLIYVAYARHDDGDLDEIPGPGRGFVNAYSPDGVLQRRLQWGPWLNAPWGIALAPADFGRFSGLLLVGQFGSGKIAAFDPASGKFRGLIRGENNRTLRIEGLWALSFGSGAPGSGPANSLYFAAGIDDEAHGLFGTLTALPDLPRHDDHHRHHKDKDHDDDGRGDRDHDND